MHKLRPLALGVGVALISALAAAPTPTPIAECFADNGIQGVTVFADGSVEIPAFTTGDNNAGQAWDAHTTRIYDLCVP